VRNFHWLPFTPPLVAISGPSNSMFEVRIKVVEVVGDSKLVVQQINMESQCLDGALNCYCKECLDIEWFR
jgi:hypothetical protein